MDYSLPHSSVHGISQAAVLEWVAISFSRGSSQTLTETESPALASGFFLPLSHQGSPNSTYMYQLLLGLFLSLHILNLLFTFCKYKYI